MEPWKTPRVSGHQLGLTPFTTTLCARPDKFNRRNKGGKRETKTQGTSQRKRGGRGTHTDQDKEVEKDKKSDGLRDEKKGQGTGQRGVTAQRAGQGHIARNKGTGSSVDMYRQRVTGSMEDRENKRKGTASGAEMVMW